MRDEMADLLFAKQLMDNHEFATEVGLLNLLAIIETGSEKVVNGSAYAPGAFSAWKRLVSERPDLFSERVMQELAKRSGRGGYGDQAASYVQKFLERRDSARQGNGTTMNLVGKKAPEFTENAVTGDGKFMKISLLDYRGQWVVLFFYPADFTSICPTEISEFSRRDKEFKDLSAVVLGCSTDSKYSHKEWIKGSLGTITHPLIADSNKKIARLSVS